MTYLPSSTGAASPTAANPSSRVISAAAKRRLALIGLGITLVGVALLNPGESAVAQMGDKPALDAELEAGIPVTDKLVIEKCGTCHSGDVKGNLSRISWNRTTPEGWAQVIHRMVKLNGLQISPDDARKVIRSLAGSHGLAPEEAKAVMYLPEHRLVEETNIPNETVRAACASCHAFAQPLSWRRSSTEWKLLQDLHVALYAQAETQYRRPVDDNGMPQSGPAAAKMTTPGVVALDYMRKNAPLMTPEWSSWSAKASAPALAGKWLVSASIPGKGRYAGTMTIAPEGDSFATTTTLYPLAGGTPITRKGSGLVYAGYSWRGRSSGGSSGGASAPDAPESAARETMWFAPDRKSATGRWFWGAYEEFGWDVKLTRATSQPTISAVAPYALKAGSTGVSLRILGDKLPTGLSPADIGLGKGVVVRKILSASPDELVVNVDVAADAGTGLRDISVGEAAMEKALPIYRKVDFLKVTPETTIARLGGSEKHPKGYQQFEAIGFDKGADGKPGTGDDVPVGPVDVTWSMGEFPQVYYDDDVNFVGKLSQTALFTPALDGPNPQRKWGRNNYGEVWVVATAKAEKDAAGKPLTAKGLLTVSVPAYKRWDQPEVAQ